MLFCQISGISRRKRIKPVLKGCCITKSPFSTMYFLTILVVAVFYIVTNKSGVGVALVHSNPPPSAGSFSLLFTTGTSLSFFTPKNFSKSVLLSKLYRATHVDYFVDESFVQIFWYDIAENIISRAYLTDTGVGNISVIVSRGIADVKEVIIDRFSRNIYWVDAHHRRVEVATVDGALRTTLVSDVHQPNGLDIDPEVGYLFWSSENGSQHYIERSFLNGKGRKAVISHFGSLLFTLDVWQKLIYWTDRSGILYRADYEGGHGVVLGNVESLSSVHSLAFWNDTLYWTDSIHQTVNKVEVGNLRAVEVLTLAYPQLYGMKIFHPKALPARTRSKCLFENGGCSHLCLAGRNLAPSCHCPYGLQINHDNKTCTEYNPILGFATTDGRLHHFYFVQFHKPNEWIFPPLAIHDAKEKSLTIDPVRRKIYWISGQNILTQSAQDNSSPKTVIHLGYFRPEALAFDWISGNLFMLLLRDDNETGTLSVTSSAGKLFTHLVWKDFYKPGLLSVDSKNKILFWSHSQSATNGSFYYIESCSFDGRARKRIFHSISDQITSLFSDSFGKKVCWSTNNSRSVLCVSYNSEQPTILVPDNSTSTFVVPSSNGLLFYSDANDTLKGINVSSEHDSFSITDAPPNISYVAIFDFEEQQKDPCSEANFSTESSSLCLPLSENQTAFKSNDEKPFLVYVTESSEPHSISLRDEREPDVFPSAIFRPDASNNFDFLCGNRTHYFWIEEKSVNSINQDGTDFKRIVQAEFPITGLAVDWIAGNLYWSVSEKSMIWVSRQSGEYPYIIISRDTEYPTSLTVHPILGLLFWKECYQSCAIQRSTLNGQRRHTVVDAVQGMGEFDVDREENLIYWISAEGLERCDIDGNGRELFISASTAAPVSFAIAHDSIYWIESSGVQDAGSVMQTKKNARDVTIVKNVTASWKLRHVSKEYQIGKNPCLVDNGGCQHLCLYEGAQRYSCQCSYSSLALDKKTCIDDRSYILLANRHRIDSVRGDDYANPNPPRRSIFAHPSIRNVVALCYHREIVYFSDLHQAPFLFSVRVDGSGFRPILKESAAARQIEGIAFEEEKRLLLWTDNVTPSIGQYSLASRQEKKLFSLKSSDKPRGIAVASSIRKVFWTNWNDVGPKIETAFLNGSGHRTLLLSTLGRPNGLTVDGDDLYWTDTSANVDVYWISSCRLDGSNSRIVYAGSGGHPFDIVSFGKFLFWSDWGIGAIWKAHKSGPPQVQLVLKNLTRPLGLTTVGNAKNQEKEYAVRVHVDRCRNGCAPDTGGNPKSCAECPFAITEQEKGSVPTQTEICIIVAVILIVCTVVSFCIIRSRLSKRRKQSRKKCSKNSVRQIYKSRLNSLEPDRLTMDAVVVIGSMAEDDRASLVTNAT